VYLAVSVQIEHTLSDQLQQHWATAVQFYMTFLGYMTKWERYLHIRQFPHFIDDWNEIGRMEESFDRLWIIQKVPEILNNIFLKFTSLPKIRQQKSLFFSSKDRQFSNNVFPRNTNILALKYTNCATPLVTLTSSKCT